MLYAMWIVVRMLVPRLMIALVLGAAITWGVAWWFAWSSPAARDRASLAQVPEAVYLGPRTTEGVSGAVAEHSTGWARAYAVNGPYGAGSAAAIRQDPVNRLPRWALIPGAGASNETTGAGWPMIALRGSHSQASIFARGRPSWEHLLRIRDGGPAGGMNGYVELPLLPDALGFGVDSAFFGVFVMAPLLIGPVRRLRAARCLACGYDLSATVRADDGRVTCPECGRGTRRRFRGARSGGEA